VSLKVGDYVQICQDGFYGAKGIIIDSCYKENQQYANELVDCMHKVIFFLKDNRTVTNWIAEKYLLKVK
jgi:hypothetical protein